VEVSLLRTLLFVPGSRQAMIEKAAGLRADAIILDLEDSVAPAEKENARRLVKDAVPALAAAGREVWVRVNSTYTGMAKDDCRSAIGPHLTGILLPKADSPEIVRYAEALLRDAEAMNGVETGTIRLIAHIETAKGLLAVERTSQASERIVGLAFGSEDYTADMQIERTREGKELGFARGMIGVSARAAGIAAIDTVYPFLHDLEGLTQEARQARQAGFVGKLLIHPEQIDPVQAVFMPGVTEIEAARRIVEGYEAASADGRGSLQVDGMMVDEPVVRRARKILDLTEATQRG
jgi:citrate lyase subunit beta / citryl-CoA lyase